MPRDIFTFNFTGSIISRMEVVYNDHGSNFINLYIDPERDGYGIMNPFLSPKSPLYLADFHTPWHETDPGHEHQGHLGNG